MDQESFIIECPNCAAKNRIRTYSAEQVPVCAKCRTPLVDADENEAHARYTKNLENFNKLPDFEVRPRK